MPKKKYISNAPNLNKNVKELVFDGEGRDFKDIIRLSINRDVWHRSQKNPANIFTLLGAECSDLILFDKEGLKINRCVSVEKFEKEYRLQRSKIRTFAPKLKNVTHAYNEDIREYFSLDRGTKKDKEIFQNGFDLMFLDYIGCFDQRMIKDIEILALNKVMLYNALDRAGSIYLYLTTSSRFQNPHDYGALENIAEQYSNLSPKIEQEGKGKEDDDQLYQDHLQAYGIHYKVSEIFLNSGIRCEPVHCLYYKDGNKGTRMLFSGWKLTKIDDSKLKKGKIKLLGAMAPVYIGFRNRKDHQRSIQWAQEMRDANIIRFREDEYSMLADSHKDLKNKDQKSFVRLNKLYRILGKRDIKLLEIATDDRRGIIPNIMDTESRLALIEQGIIKKPKSNTKEDWAKMAVAMARCLKSHKGAVSQSTLTKAVVTLFPEYKELQKSPAGKLNQSKLTNAMAWSKAALKQGGYTTSKKDCIAGEILKLTDKGRNSNLNKRSVNNWSEHYSLIKSGKLK